MTTVTRDYANFPYDTTMADALKKAGFDSIYDIIAVDEERFRVSYDATLNGCAAAVYSQARAFLPLANRYAAQNATSVDTDALAPLPAVPETSGHYYDNVVDNTPRITRHRTPVWQALFGQDVTRYAEPGGIQSLDSPVCYLLYLLNQLKNIRDGSSTAMARLFLRRPDLEKMLLTSAAMNQIIPASELAGEVIMDAVSVIQDIPNRDELYTRLENATYPLTMPFDVAAERTRLALGAVSLSPGNVYSVLDKNYRKNTPRHNAELAWGGITAGLADMLTKPLPDSLAPVVLRYKGGSNSSTTALKGNNIDLSQLWPGQKLGSATFANQAVTLHSGTQTINATLQGVSAEERMSYVLTVDKQPEEKAIYRGNATLSISAYSVTRSIDVSIILLGSAVPDSAISDVFKEVKTTLEATLGTEIAERVAPVMSVPAEMLSQVVGVSTQQLTTLLGGGEGTFTAPAYPGESFNGRIAGASYLWGNPAGVKDTLPGEVVDGMLTLTPYHLLRLQKFVRLMNHTGMNATELDLILQAALSAEKANDITAGTLRALGVFIRYRDVYGVSAAEFAALLSAIPVWSHNNDVSLWDRLFSADAMVPNEQGTGLTAVQKAAVAAAGAMSPEDVDLLYSLGWPKQSGRASVSALLRPALLAKCLGLSVRNLLGLIAVVTNGAPGASATFTLLSAPTINDATPDTPDLLILLDEALNWMKDNRWSADDVVALATKDLTAEEKSTLIEKWHDNPPSTAADLAPALAELTGLSLVTATALASVHLALLKAFNNQTIATPLLLSVEVIRRYNLSELALQPWLSTGLFSGAEAEFWPQLLLMSDYAGLANGEEPATPAVITSLYSSNWKKRLADIYDAGTAAAEHILTADTYNPEQHALLARRASYARKTGWSVDDINVMLDSAPAVLTFAQRIAFSLRVGPASEGDKKNVVNRLGERRNLAVLALYKSLCRQHFIKTENLTGERAFNEHYPDTAEVAGQLLTDATMTANVTTSRVSEAVAAVQAFIQRIVEGQEEGLQLTAGEMQRWKDTDSQYAIWAADVQLHWHPDQYIMPSARLNKTPAFTVFENRLSQSRLDNEQIEDALTGYLNEFEQTVNLSTVAGYQDGIDTDNSPVYFLGRSQKAPYDYWFRRWGNNDASVRVWSAWEKIQLPMQQNVMLKPATSPDKWQTTWSMLKDTEEDVQDFTPVQARLVVFNGRLYFIWVSIRAVTEDTMTDPSGSASIQPTNTVNGTATAYVAPVKKYRHVISAVHRRLNGDWSVPVEIFHGKADTDKNTDSTPHLNAFVLPEHTASMQGMISPDMAPESGDQLMVTLMPVPENAEQKPDTTYLLFDSFLNEISPDVNTLWSKNNVALNSVGVSIDKLTDKQLSAYILKLNKDSYLWRKQKQQGTDSISGTERYLSTRVITPCIPHSWLYSDRHMLTRGQAVFGNAVKLTLDVQDAGQAGRSTYIVNSVVSLTDSQYKSIPQGYKLVHFLTYRGVSRYSRVSNNQDTVSVVGDYGQAVISQGTVRHGLVLVKAETDNVVYVDGVKDALTETGYLSVAHVEVQQTAAEIRENSQGVQFLISRHPEVLSSDIDGASHAIHASNDPLTSQQYLTLAGVSFKLLISSNGAEDELKKAFDNDIDWSDAIFTASENNNRNACWTYDLSTGDTGKTMQIITRIEKFSKQALSIGVFDSKTTFWQDGTKIDKGNVVESKPLWIVTLVDLSAGDKSEGASFTKSSVQPDMNGYSPLGFRFRVGAESAGVKPSSIWLRIVSSETFSDQNDGLMTAANWGWLSPDFYQKQSILLLNRKYQLLSTEPQYFLLKIKVPAKTDRNIDVDNSRKRAVGLSLILKNQASGAVKIYGIKTNKAEEISLQDPQATGAGFIRENGAVMLVAPNTDTLNGYIDSYTYFFIAMPWAPGSVQDAADNGLQFVFDPLSKDKTFTGRVDVEVPSLSRVSIASSCSSDKVSPGDIVTISVEVNARGEVFTASDKLVISFDKAYQLIHNGMITPPNPAIDADAGTVTFTGLAQQMSFRFPVKVVGGGNNSTPLATISLFSQSSSERVALKQPVITDNLATRVTSRLGWQFGNDVASLGTVDATQSITRQQLGMPCLTATLTINADRNADIDVIATLRLPKGLQVQQDGSKIKALAEASARRGEQLITADKLLEKSDEKGVISGVINTQYHLPAGQTVTLAFPLEITKDAPQFMGSLQASLKSLQGTDPFWSQETAVLIQPVQSDKKILEVSASFSTEQLTTQFGDPLNLQLIVNALKDSSDNTVTLQLGRGYSWQQAPATLESQGKITLVTPTEDKSKGTLAFPKNNLKANETFILRVPVVAQASADRKSDNDVTHFTLTDKDGENITTHDLPLPVALLRGVNITTRFYKADDTPLAENETLVKGAAYKCGITLNLSADDINHQTSGTSLSTGEFSTCIQVMVSMPGFKAFDKDQVKLVGLTASPNGLITGLGAARRINLACIYGQDLSGTITFPVEVSDPALASFTTSVTPPGTVANAPRQWLPNLDSPATLVRFTSWDPGKAPYSDLHFSHGGGNTFSEPVNFPSPTILDNGEGPVLPQRLVRLNSNFGIELVRTAERDVRILFEPAIQDHPLPAMVTGGKTDTLEQDTANLSYFWELFFHVPLLIAERLNGEGRYQEAQRWLNYLFEPFAHEENGQPPEPWKCRLLKARFSYVSADTLKSVADPDLIASLQPVYYQRAVFFAYVKNILDQGDSQFRTLTRDGFNHAHQCYLLASRLLGDDDNGSLMPAWVPSGMSSTVTDYVRAVALKNNARFFIPRSQKHHSLLIQLQQRLYNLRNGLTLDGKPLSLPLYDTPVDPALLQQARASGLSGNGLSSTQKPSPSLFRYNVIYARASAAVEVVVQFGNQLLAVSERQQDVSYQVLLCQQQKTMAQFVLDSLRDTLSLSQAARAGIEAACDGAKSRQAKLASWIKTDISGQENGALNQRSRVRDLNISGSSMMATGALLDVLPNIFGLADGGYRLAAIPNAAGVALNTTAESIMSDALAVEIRASYSRRMDEWEMQKLAVDAEVSQLEAQLRADTLQTQIYQRQLAQTGQQLQQFDDQLQFIQNRFTSEALYQWLSGQISALYYQSWDIATSLCLLAQEAWRYETGTYDSEVNYFSGISWQSSQRGLSAGETLRLGLMRMDKDYLTRSTRKLELRHTFSVKTAKPDNWNTFTTNMTQSNGKPDTAILALPFSVTEKDMYERYPGLYQRQVVAVTVTLPCLVGPYEDIRAVLVQKTGFFTVKADLDAEKIMLKGVGADTKNDNIRNTLQPSSQIALSSGLDDAGAFVVSFNDDRLLPFEGNGVVGDWELQFPLPGLHAQQKILTTLTDVIVTFHYRALDGGIDYASKVIAAVNSPNK